MKLSKITEDKYDELPDVDQFSNEDQVYRLRLELNSGAKLTCLVSDNEEHEALILTPAGMQTPTSYQSLTRLIKERGPSIVLDLIKTLYQLEPNGWCVCHLLNYIHNFYCTPVISLQPSKIAEIESTRNDILRRQRIMNHEIPELFMKITRLTITELIPWMESWIYAYAREHGEEVQV